MRILIFILALLFISERSTTQHRQKPIKRLVAHYPLTEGAGLIAFPRGCVSRGTINTCTWVQSPLGKCLNWAGPTNNYVQLGKLSNLNLQGPMTVSAWIRITDVSGGVNSGYRYICSDYDSGPTDAQFALVMLNTVKISFFWSNAGNQAPGPTVGQGATTIVANKIYHVVGTRSGTSTSWTTAVYLNGIRDGGSTTSVNPPTQAASGTTTIGRTGDYQGMALGMVGQIRDVRIYDYALTPSEVLALYLEGPTK